MEIGDLLVGNLHRKNLFANLINCICNEIRPLFDEPIYINGSFVTDKKHQDDIDIVFDLRDTPDERKGNYQDNLTRRG